MDIKTEHFYLNKIIKARSFVTYDLHVMTVDCRDDKDIKKQFRRQNEVGDILVRKFSFAPTEAKIRFFKSYIYCYPIYGCAHWRHSY